MKKETFFYVDSVETYLKRIEIFSISNRSCPFYTLTGKNGDIVIGGARGGRLSEMEDPIFEARIFNGLFLADFVFSFEHGRPSCSYETAKAKADKVVADTGMMEPQRVLIDLYYDGKNIIYALGGSSYLLNRKKDGTIGFVLDAVEAEKMGIAIDS